MRFADLMADQKFVLVVSLPANDLALAEAALDGGAHAVKVHCNVWHRASGHTFGTFSENKDFLKELVRLCGDVPVGLVPGTSEAFITESELRELEEMGLDFISAYSQHLPAFALDSRKITNAVAIGSDYTESLLDAVREVHPDEIVWRDCSAGHDLPDAQGMTFDRYADKLLGDKRYTTGELDCDGLLAAHEEALKDYKKRKKQYELYE
jgi:hypothetical protein